MTEKLKNQWFYHAVADIILANSLLRSFPEVIYVFADYVTRASTNPIHLTYRKNQNGILDFAGESGNNINSVRTSTYIRLRMVDLLQRGVVRGPEVTSYFRTRQVNESKLCPVS